MKYSVTLLFSLFSIYLSAQYQINSYKGQGLSPNTKAPNMHYLGSAWLKGLVAPQDDLNVGITLATFSANSTLDWHQHETGQVLIIVAGNAYYQERGKEVVILKEGDVLKCDKNIEHWHSSTPDSDVSYIAIYGGGSPTTWTEKVTQEYYDTIQVATPK